MSLSRDELIELHELEDIEADCRDLEEPIPSRYKRRLVALRKKRNVCEPPAVIKEISNG